MLVEKGTYVGYGFFDKTDSISDFESAKTLVKRSVETPTVQSLINGYVANPRGASVVVFDKVVLRLETACLFFHSAFDSGIKKRHLIAGEHFLCINIHHR